MHGNVPEMVNGNMERGGVNLILDEEEASLTRLALYGIVRMHPSPKDIFFL